MSGKSNYLEAMILELLFNGTTDAALASAAGSATNLYVSLHTADPGDAGTQATNEVTTGQYALYARVAVARSAGGWTVSGTSPGSVSPVAAITFPTTNATGTGCTASYFGVGLGASGAADLLYSGAITPNITIPATTADVIPQLTKATTVTEG
jgi:hypothetical protein